METIVIWESNIDRIYACESAVSQALQELGLPVQVTINAEPPLISRHNLWLRLPVLEIRGQYWSLCPGQPFTREQLVPLFRGIYLGGKTDQFGKDTQTMSNDNMNLTDENYGRQLIHATGVVLFHKKLCPNCKALGKMLDKFNIANPEVKHFSIDSEECPEAMKHFGVERVPTVLILKEGQVAGRKVGLMNMKEMTEFHRSA